MSVRYIDVSHRIVRVSEGHGQCCNIRSGDGETGHAQGDNAAGELHLDDFQRLSGVKEV